MWSLMNVIYQLYIRPIIYYLCQKMWWVMSLDLNDSFLIKKMSMRVKNQSIFSIGIFRATTVDCWLAGPVLENPLFYFVFAFAIVCYWQKCILFTYAKFFEFFFSDLLLIKIERPNERWTVEIGTVYTLFGYGLIVILRCFHSRLFCNLKVDIFFVSQLLIFNVNQVVDFVKINKIEWKWFRFIWIALTFYLNEAKYLTASNKLYKIQ